ncbi:MAG: hypothetical protein GX484_11655 [Chloroflexi bacterium]|nr:hypothetical protein [Chloroflexota bacterium]
MRRSFVSVTWTPDVDPAAAELLIPVVEDVYDLLRPHFGKPGQFDPLPQVRVFGAWELTGVPEKAAYRDMLWFARHSLDDEHRYILASRYIRIVMLEPWQGTHPHLDLALTAMPILDDRPGPSLGKQTLGASRRALVSLISTQRLRQIESPTLRQLAMRHVFQHYMGQMFNAPDPLRGKALTMINDEAYCTNVCAMRYTPTAKEALAYGQEQASQAIIYCDDCQRDLVARITGFHYGVN